MYIISAILELSPETNHDEVIDYYENQIASSTVELPGIEKITCMKLRAVPFSPKDRMPLRNLFYQLQIYFESEEAVQLMLQDEHTMNILDNFLSYSDCTFHWFVGHENTFIKVDYSHT